MNNFTYFNPTKIVFGKGVIDSLSNELVKLKAKKVLLVYGQKSIKENGLFNKITAGLKDARIEYIEHPGVCGNPVLSHAREGIELAKIHDIDMICAIGGGSVIDEAKAISAGVLANCDVWEFYAKRQIPTKAMRLVAVLTLPATASEMNGISVLTNGETNEKVALVCPGILNPVVSFLDPETTFSLSAKQTAYACADIISHLTEGYFTTTANETIVQDKIIESTIHAVMESMAKIKYNPLDYEARAAFMWCATLAWSGLLQAGLCNWGMPCHALEMPMSALYNIAHGAGLSVIIPAWVEIAGEKHKKRLIMFAENIFSLKSDSLTEIAARLREYYQNVGAPTTFTQAGVDTPDIDLMAKLAHESFIQRGVAGYDMSLIKDIYSASL